MFLLFHNFEDGSASLPHLLDVFACWMGLIEAAVVLLEGV